MTPRWRRVGISALVFALVVSQAGCDYQPDVATLEIEAWGTAEAPSGGVPAPTAAIPGLATPFPSSQNPGQPASSAEAMEMCEAAFIYGDEDVGYCQLPGGTSYLLWAQSGEVFQIEAGDPFLDEFVRAVTARSQDLSDTETRGVRAMLEGFGLLGAYLLVDSNCAGGGWAARVRCAAGIITFFVAGLALPNDAQGISIGWLRSLLEEARAVFYLCQLRGGEYEACLEASGLSEEMLEGTYGT